MAHRILVTGATGKLGRELVRLLLARGEIVRAATRFPSEASKLFGASVEVVEMDYDSTETWDNAVQWVDRLFLMPPPFDPHAFDTLAPFLDWSVASGVGKVVLLSAMGIDDVPELALRRLEEQLSALNITSTCLRPNLYMQNLADGLILQSIRERDRIELCAGDGRVSFVDARDVAAVADIALCGPSLDGATCTLTGEESFSFGEVADRLSRVAGRTIGYAATTTHALRDALKVRRWSDGAIAVAVALFQAIDRGEREPVHPDLARLLGRPASSLDSFTAEHAAAWR